MKPHLGKKRRGAIITLPGRSLPVSLMMRFCKELHLSNTMVAGIQPEKYQWYPMPFGVNNQQKACEGMEVAYDILSREIDGFLKWQNLKKEETVLLGFSAGAVMALQLAVRSEEKWAACVSLGGAILEPDKVGPVKNETPLILQHNRNDQTFEWFERYLPMRDALENQGHNVVRMERPYGDHCLYREDALAVSRKLSVILGYSQKYFETKVLPYFQKS